MKNKYVLFISILFITACKSTVNELKNKLFVSVSAEQTGVTFENRLIETAEWNIIQYLYFYNGGGVAVGDINDDGLPDIYFTANQGSNKLYINKGNFTFEDVTEKAGVADVEGWKTGVTMVDINGDGQLDIYVCHVSNYKNIAGKNRLFINNHGVFTDKAAEYGLDATGLCTQAAFFDSDGDGDLDCYLMRHSIHSPSSYRPVKFRMDNDSLSSDILFRNFGSHHFADISKEANIHDGSLGYGLGLAVGDINADGAPDIYVGNDFHDNDYLYYNDGKGKYTEGVNNSMGHNANFSMGNDLADFNNDGRLDFIGLDMKPEEETILKQSGGAESYNIFDYKNKEYGFLPQFSRNMLQLNRGNVAGKQATFSEIGQFSGISATDWSWASLFADLDNDGYKDLFITNGIAKRPNDLDYNKYISSQEVQKNASDLDLAHKMPEGKAANYAFRNKGDLTFENTSNTWGLNQIGNSNGAAYADLDDDGDLDLIVNNINEKAFILKNTSEKTDNHNYLKIKLVGKGENRKGIGAKVIIYQKGRDPQFLEQSLTRGFQSSVEPILHFGLGADSTDIDSLRIIWRDNKTDILTDISVNKILYLHQNDAETIWNYRNNLFYDKKNNAQNIVFYDITHKLNLKYKHSSDIVYDNDNGKLIPHFLSTENPKMAVGDMNGDGLEDFFISGNTGQADAFFFQNKTASFDVSIAKTPDMTSFESSSSTLFDADGDKDLDIYVTSFCLRNSLTGYFSGYDKLLINDGKGKYVTKRVELPAHRGSCVKTADFDGDGDLDVFVGGRADVKTYGLSAKSFLLQNDGYGNFKDMTPQYAPLLDSIGMVTDAVWTDLDGDKRPDLVVVGEWFPLTIFYNKGDHFEPKEMDNTAGWWKCVAAADLDNDGKPDLVIGNMGLNSNWQASTAQPMSLYLKDFDNNGSIEPIITYWRQSTEWVFASKDEIAAQMPTIRKVFPEYVKFANSPFDKVFPKAVRKNVIEKHIQQFSSIVLMNKGKGEYELKPLPTETQFSTVESLLIEDFDGDGVADIVLGGNFYEMQPSIGRFDASIGSVLKGDGQGNFTPLDPLKTGWILRGAVRDIKKVGKHLVVSANNSPLQIFDIKKK